MPNPLHPPLRNDSAATLAGILEAAQAILLEHGPNGLTVRATDQQDPVHDLSLGGIRDYRH